jgi:hypothetical protein
MVAALASREPGRPVNRKRVQRVVCAHRLFRSAGVVPATADLLRQPPFADRVSAKCGLDRLVLVG